LLVALVWCVDLAARQGDNKLFSKDLNGLKQVLVLDGSNVHNVGELWLHVTNWGLFGSYPGAGFPFSNAPSAEWPADSGVNYLYGAGLWVGAVKSGVPAVSTAMYDMEFRPTDDPVDIIYRSAVGALGGNRLPSPFADDDRDGTIDEDWLNGRDDDMDGLVDEDFAAISDQMFSCWYTDDQPGIEQSYPQHNPMHLQVRQESYQWADDRFDDCVAIHFIITNIGTDLLEDVYLGFFVDADAGPIGTGEYWEDDAVRFVDQTVVCTDLGPVDISMAYSYDADGDGGQTPGYLGVLLLDHTTDPLGINAPKEARIVTFANFSGSQPFEEGGDPTNDFERYELLSQETIDRDATVPRDYRMLIGVGPFEHLNPGESLTFTLAFVMGDGLDGLIQNAANMKALYDGTWYNLDGNPLTGIDRRETPIEGPASDVVVDPCRPELSNPVDVAAGQVLWINTDCEMENEFQSTCGYSAADSLEFLTGVNGREAQVHWDLGYLAIIKKVSMDIKPGACPNPFNMNFDEAPAKNNHSMKGGVLTAALLGGPDFDVTEVYLEQLELEGVRPVQHEFKDIGGPAEGTNACACPSTEPDGYTDLVLKFRRADVAAALDSGSRGEMATLTLWGEMPGGIFIEAKDCVKIVGKGPDGPRTVSAMGDEVRLDSAVPNPFNPSTMIRYYLPEEAAVTLSIYDVNGKLVERLVDGMQGGGEYVIRWNAAGKASGVYFYRLTAGDVVRVKRMVLLK